MGFFMMEYWKQSNKKRITLRYLPTLLLNTLKGVCTVYIIALYALIKPCLFHLGCVKPNNIYDCTWNCV